MYSFSYYYSYNSVYIRKVIKKLIFTLLFLEKVKFALVIIQLQTLLFVKKCEN